MREIRVIQPWIGSTKVQMDEKLHLNFSFTVYYNKGVRYFYVLFFLLYRPVTNIEILLKSIFREDGRVTMEEKYLLKCIRCLAPHHQIPITSIDGEGNLYCIRCSNYLGRVGSYDLMPFKPGDFIEKNEKQNQKVLGGRMKSKN